MIGELIWITGVTDHLGLYNLVFALRGGYHGRAVVRTESKTKDIFQNPSIVSLDPGSRWTFCLVLDITSLGAYKNAVQGIEYIIYTTCPIIDGITCRSAYIVALSSLKTFYVSKLHRLPLYSTTVSHSPPQSCQSTNQTFGISYCLQGLTRLITWRMLINLLTQYFSLI